MSKQSGAERKAAPARHAQGRLPRNRDAESWLHMAAVIDLFSRRVVGWSVGGRMQRRLAIAALQTALTMRISSSAAELYFGLPVWMNLVFAIGSFGGLIASLMLGARRCAAIPILTVSLAGYVALLMAILSANRRRLLGYSSPRDITRQ